MSALSSAAAFHLAGLQWLAGLSATYSRPSTGEIAATTVIDQGGARGQEYATRLGSTPEETDYVLFTPEIGYHAFSIVAGDLAGFATPSPLRGDTITIGSEVYTVQSPDGLEPWVKEDWTVSPKFRVHTKQTT